MDTKIFKILLTIISLMFLFSCSNINLSDNTSSFFPDDPYFLYDRANPNYPGQWNLYNMAPSVINYKESLNPDGHYTEAVSIQNVGLDANIVNVWAKGYTGKGIVIGILDDGVQFEHPDLLIRRDLSTGINETALVDGQDGNITSQNDNHGTCVAGMAAGIGGNGIGICGHAPKAEIASIRINFSTLENYYTHAPGYYWQAGFDWQSGMDSTALAGLINIKQQPSIHVKNSSSRNAPFDYPPNFTDAYSALARMSANNVLFSLASGNMRKSRQQDANVYLEVANPYAISVSAIGSNAKYALYSCFGSGIFVGTLSESANWNLLKLPNESKYAVGLGVSSTDLLGANGINYKDGSQTVFLPDLADYDYTSQFDGTSASAPALAGILAVVKEANPNFNLRMAKHLLAQTSRVVDTDDSSASSTWTVNGKTYSGWQTNAAGLKFNNNYGFGLPDTQALLEHALNTFYVTDETIYNTGLLNADETILPTDSSGKTKTIEVTVPENIKQKLESIEVYVDMTGGNRSEWQIILQKDLTTSRLWCPANEYPNNGGFFTDDPNFNGGLNRTFLTNAFWGENMNGTWALNISNPTGNNTANWNKWGLIFHMGEIRMATPGLNQIETNLKVRGISINNNSTILKIADNAVVESTGDVLINQGQLIVNGTLKKGNDVTVSKLDLNLLSPSETLSYDRGIKIEIKNSTVSGSGTIISPLGTDLRGGIENIQGILEPGDNIGILTIGTSNQLTNFSQKDKATLEIEVNGTNLAGTDYDQLKINGNAVIGGTINIITNSSVIVNEGDTINDIITANLLTCSFSTINSNINSSLYWKPIVISNSVDIVATLR